MSLPVEMVPVDLMPVEMQAVEIWAPGLDSDPLAAALAAARLPLRQCPTLEQADGQGPLLLAYGDPLALLPPHELPDHLAYQPLLAAIPVLEQGPRPWRLVNLACLCPPALVAWCVQPDAVPPRPAVSYGFAPPEALDALVALQWLQAQPQLLTAYLSLERHPRAATLDHRPADDDCPARLQAACSAQALAAARLRRCQLLEELERAEQQRQHLHQAEHDNQALRDRLLSLELEREALNAQISSLESRRADLELTLQLSHEELGQLGRRIALLEQLVNDGAEASRSVQEALAQVLGS